MELQFGYGSNMHPKRLEKKEGIENILTTARRARLYDWKFGFTKKGDDGSGKANIIPSDGDIVWGLLIELDSEEVKKMDGSEGVPRHYVRTDTTNHHPLRAVTDDGEVHDCIAYVANKNVVNLDGITPTDEYLGYIVEGAALHGIPDDYIMEIKRLAEP